jgi:hypothetical protein
MTALVTGGIVIGWLTAGHVAAPGAQAQDAATFVVTLWTRRCTANPIEAAAAARWAVSCRNGDNVSATPHPWYALDSTWYPVPGRFSQTNHEAMTRAVEVTRDQNKRVGASFIAESAVIHITAVPTRIHFAA